MADTRYSNHVNVRTGFHDVILEFIHQTPSPDDQTPMVAVNQGSVVLPLTIIRPIVAILTAHLQQYEQKFGPVPQEPKREQVEDQALASVGH